MAYFQTWASLSLPAGHEVLDEGLAKSMATVALCIKQSVLENNGKGISFELLIA